MSIKLLPYKAGSASAKALALGLGIKRLKLVGSKWQGKAGDTVINWGNSKGQPIGAAAILNNPVNVGIAANKLKAQQAFKGKPYCLPSFTTKEQAQKIMRETGCIIVCRTKLTGNSGEGIVIAENIGEIVDAPLYTMYKKKTQEYRVHVFDGEVISIQRKARKADVPDEDVNWKVRNLDGGFIFARTGFDVPQEVVDAAKGAMKDLQLDFGAVDIGYHKKEGTFVYEVNTACGLDGSNLTDYIEAFCKKLNLPVPPRPEDYVAPTLPGQAQREPMPVPNEPKQERIVLSNADVINIVTKHGDNKVEAIKEVVDITGFKLQVAKDMVDRAANVIAARKVLEEPKAPEPKVVHPLGSKENPLGEELDGAVLRQVRPDLNERDDNTNQRRVDEYAGKWVWFVERYPDMEYGFRIPNDGQWSWGESHLVPYGTYEFKLGNINKKLNEEQQAKLAAFVLQL